MCKIAIFDDISTYIDEKNDDFTFDLEQMKIDIDSKRTKLDFSVLESDEIFDNWLNSTS